MTGHEARLCKGAGLLSIKWQLREVSAGILRSAARAADVLEFRVDLLGSLDHGNIVHQARCQGVSRKKSASNSRLSNLSTALPCPTMDRTFED